VAKENSEVATSRCAESWGTRQTIFFLRKKLGPPDAADRELKAAESDQAAADARALQGSGRGDRGAGVGDHGWRDALLTFVSAEETARLSRELNANRAALDQLLKEWERSRSLIAAQA